MNTKRKEIQLPEDAILRGSAVSYVIKHQVLEPHNLTQKEFARRCSLAEQVVSELCNPTKHERRVTPAIAHGLAQGSHISALSWLQISKEDELAWYRASERAKAASAGKAHGQDLFEVEEELEDIDEAYFDDDDFIEDE